MTLPTVLAILAAIAFLAYIISSLVPGGERSRRGFIMPAVLSISFLAFSLCAVILESPTGFWPEHVRNLWANQIWFDLLLAVGVAWTLMLPRARAVDMNVPAWLVFVVATGCIGLTAMLSRLLYLESKSESVETT